MTAGEWITPSGEGQRSHPLRKLKGRVAVDGIERISTTDVFGALEVPMRHRPSLTVRLSKLMGQSHSLKH
jgi:hypothetical protein